MLTITNGRSLRDGIETIGRDRFQLNREGLESLGREGLQAGREGLQASREGLQTIGSSVAELAETLPVGRKRRRSFPLIGAIVVAIAGAALIALFLGLQARRDSGLSVQTPSKARGQFDDEPGDQAKERTGAAVGASAADDLVSGTNGHDATTEYSGLSRAPSA
jgi:hypothetical protein